MNLVTFALLALMTAPAAHDAQVNPGKATRVVLRAGQGDIHVRAARQTTVKVSAHAYPGSENCTTSAAVEGKAVVIKITNPLGSPCHADVDVFSPAQMDLDITAETGTVYASGTRGAFVLHLQQGNAVVGGRFTSLDATLEQGSLSANGLFGDATVSLTRGNAQLWFESTQGSVQLSVARGNVTIVTPASKAAVRANLLHGTLQSAVATAASGAFSVDGTIEQGNLTIRSK